MISLVQFGTHFVVVDSPGGRFEFFSVVGPAIERRGITMLAGNVRSAAVILYLLGHRRLAFQDSVFFFHEVRTLVDGAEITLTDLEEVEEYASRMRADHREHFEEWGHQMRTAQAWFVRFIAEQTRVPPDVFLNLMREEATLNAREAMHLGIVHEIIRRPRD
jgi:ATP-dependent protease ClpP protease subunit